MLMLGKIDSSTRLFMILMTVIMGLGIWLSGYNSVHWLLYIPPIAFLIAAIIGICPGMLVSRLLLGKK